MSDLDETSAPKFPEEPIDAIATPFQRFIHTETAGGVVLLLAATIALVVANSALGAGFDSFWTMTVGLRVDGTVWDYPLRHWINDGLVTLFFFVVGLEIKREIACGELSESDAAALPVIAAVGGMVVPAALYLALASGPQAASTRGPGKHLTAAAPGGRPAPVVSVLPLFALANAGVAISATGVSEPITLATVAGLTIGKPLGIFTFAWFAVTLGFARKPEEITWPMLLAAGLLAGIGFTMAIFIANLAFDGEALQSAKLGILMASVFSGAIGTALLWMLSSKED